jgi:uncharacterized surface protein with fasciclin (FAS1) repeats/plastocyanin
MLIYRNNKKRCMKKLFVVLAILFIGILLAGCTSQPPAPVVTPTPTPVPTTAPQVRGCYAIIAADPQFSVLGTAIRAAKLDSALDGNGSFTILAPTDTAFGQLTNGTIASLLKDPEGQLKQVLLNHVVDNKTLLAADIVKLSSVKTMQGSVLPINTTDGVVIGGAKVTKTDIVCKNGVIHVVDRVILPPVTVKTATPTPTPSPTPQPSKTITFTRDMTIMPSTSLTIPVGGKIIWKNTDPLKPHGVAAIDAQGAKYFGGLTGVQIAYNKTFEVTFDTVGSFDYKTTFQPETTGRITVTK